MSARGRGIRKPRSWPGTPIKREPKSPARSPGRSPGRGSGMSPGRGGIHLSPARAGMLSPNRGTGTNTSPQATYGPGFKKSYRTPDGKKVSYWITPDGKAIRMKPGRKPGYFQAEVPSSDLQEIPEKTPNPRQNNINRSKWTPPKMGVHSVPNQTQGSYIHPSIHPAVQQNRQTAYPGSQTQSHQGQAYPGQAYPIKQEQQVSPSYNVQITPMGLQGHNIQPAHSNSSQQQWPGRESVHVTNPFDEPPQTGVHKWQSSQQQQPGPAHQSRPPSAYSQHSDGRPLSRQSDWGDQSRPQSVRSDWGQQATHQPQVAHQQQSWQQQHSQQQRLSQLMHHRPQQQQQQQHSQQYSHQQTHQQHSQMQQSSHNMPGQTHSQSQHSSQQWMGQKQHGQWPSQQQHQYQQHQQQSSQRSQELGRPAHASSNHTQYQSRPDPAHNYSRPPAAHSSYPPSAHMQSQALNLNKHLVNQRPAHQNYPNSNQPQQQGQNQAYHHQQNQSSSSHQQQHSQQVNHNMYHSQQQQQQHQLHPNQHQQQQPHHQQQQQQQQHPNSQTQGMMGNYHNTHQSQHSQSTNAQQGITSHLPGQQQQQQHNQEQQQQQKALTQTAGNTNAANPLHLLSETAVKQEAEQQQQQQHLNGAPMSTQSNHLNGHYIDANGAIKKEEIKEEEEEDDMPKPIEREADNSHIFSNPEIGGVAIALSHGAVLFEVAKREQHATTALKNPDRYNPTRISLVFYQHKNLNNADHGEAEYQVKAEEWQKRKIVRESKIKEDSMIPINGMHNGIHSRMQLPLKRSATEQSTTERSATEESSTENESSDEKGEVIITPVFGNKKRKSEEPVAPRQPFKKRKRWPWDDENAEEIRENFKPPVYRNMWPTTVVTASSTTTTTVTTKWNNPQPVVIGPYQRWI